MQFGLDRVLDNPSLLDPFRSIGLVTNNAARPASNPDLSGRLALCEAGVPIVRLFGPEHGLNATAADGVAVADGRDPLTGLPVVSLYGSSMRPTAAQLDGLDAVVFDIPDVGARFYTYTWTLWHVMAACEAAGLPVIILDRPNPLGGDPAAVEGPMLEARYRSFIGEDAIPIRHGMTLGELARHWHHTRYPQVDLRIVTMSGWDARPAWPEIGCRWVQTSPAMPRFESAIWYPGLCLFEGTNVSVGRGTAHPFTWIGAPWMDAARIIESMHAIALPSVRFEATTFVPTMDPYAGVPCEAIRCHVEPPGEQNVDAIRSRIRPVRTALHVLRGILQQHADHFTWARYPTAANPTGTDHFARLVGTADVAPLLAIRDTVEFDERITALLDDPKRRAWGAEARLYGY